MKKMECILTSLLVVGVFAVVVVNVNLAKIKSETFSNSIITNLALSSENAQPDNCVTNTPKGSKMKPISGFQCAKSGCNSYYSVSCVSDKDAKGCTEVACVQP
jgi:hypothetical protein